MVLVIILDSFNSISHIFLSSLVSFCLSSFPLSIPCRCTVSIFLVLLSDRRHARPAPRPRLPRSQSTQLSPAETKASAAVYSAVALRTVERCWPQTFGCRLCLGREKKSPFSVALPSSYRIWKTLLTQHSAPVSSHQMQSESSDDTGARGHILDSECQDAYSASCEIERVRSAW